MEQDAFLTLSERILLHWIHEFMKKVLFWLIIISIGIGVGYGTKATYTNSDKNVLSLHTDSVSEAKQQPDVQSPGIPVHISIPKIQVDTEVESVGMDSQGRMNVPKNADNTAWYNPGFRPGVNGSAVIDGHYDKVTGAPSVFYNVNKLSAGDSIIVTDDKGTKYTFAVDRIAKYPDDNFPLQEVFAAADVPKLNLITCQGTWNKETHNYSDRMVIYSKLVSHT